MDCVIRKCDVSIDEEKVFEVDEDAEKSKNCFNRFKYNLNSCSDKYLLPCIISKTKRTKVIFHETINDMDHSEHTEHMDNEYESKAVKLTNSKTKSTESYKSGSGKSKSEEAYFKNNKFDDNNNNISPRKKLSPGNFNSVKSSTSSMDDKENSSKGQKSQEMSYVSSSKKANQLFE